MRPRAQQVVNKAAVIDLGSNTFHMLIVERDSSVLGFKVIFKRRIFVYLIKSNNGYIAEDTFHAGLECLRNFKKEIEEYQVSTIQAIGTSALRLTTNRLEFIKAANQILGCEIRVISGLEEAQYIYRGVKLTSASRTYPSLVMDIGGGSVEFILYNSEGIVNAISVTLGSSFLRNAFTISEPVLASEKQTLFNYFDQELNVFFKIVNDNKVSTLLGSSGPFEVIEQVLDLPSSTNGVIVERDDVLSLSKTILSANLEQRRQIKRIPESRADLSKESFLLIEYCLIRIGSIKNVVISPYALKEGLVAEILNLE